MLKVSVYYGLDIHSMLIEAIESWSCGQTCDSTEMSCFYIGFWAWCTEGRNFGEDAKCFSGAFKNAKRLLKSSHDMFSDYYLWEMRTLALQFLQYLKKTNTRREPFNNCVQGRMSAPIITLKKLIKWHPYRIFLEWNESWELETTTSKIKAEQIKQEVLRPFAGKMGQQQNLKARRDPSFWKIPLICLMEIQIQEDHRSKRYW